MGTMILHHRPKPAKELISFVKRRARNARLYHDRERRLVQREPLLLPLVVQRLDEKFQAVGEPFAAVTRDISPKGVGLVHSDPIHADSLDLLAIQMNLEGRDVEVVAKVCWCNELGPFYEIGAEFVARLDALCVNAEL